MKGFLSGIVLIASLAPAPAAAQPAADARRANVSQGVRVRVTDEGGRTFTGRVAAISDSGLTLKDGSDRVEILYPAIVKIDRTRDRLWDGALGGLAIGAGIGLLAMAAEDKETSCQPEAWFCGASFGPPPSTVVLLLGGIGAGIGAGVDALIGGKKTLYERGRQVHIAPLVGRGKAAARITVAW